MSDRSDKFRQHWGLTSLPSVYSSFIWWPETYAFWPPFRFVALLLYMVPFLTVYFNYKMICLWNTMPPDGTVMKLVTYDCLREKGRGMTQTYGKTPLPYPKKGKGQYKLATKVFDYTLIGNWCRTVNCTIATSGYPVLWAHLPTPHNTADITKVFTTYQTFLYFCRNLNMFIKKKLKYFTRLKQISPDLSGDFWIVCNSRAIKGHTLKSGE